MANAGRIRIVESFDSLIVESVNINFVETAKIRFYLFIVGITAVIGQPVVNIFFRADTFVWINWAWNR